MYQFFYSCNNFESNLLQLPDVVLIKDEDSDSNDTFDEGESKRHTGPVHTSVLFNMFLPFCTQVNCVSSHVFQDILIHVCIHSPICAIMETF